MSAKTAIIGKACRLPGAATVTEFWHLLDSGRSAIREIPPARWPKDLYFDPRRGAPGKSVCKWGGFIENVDCFDHDFFGVSAREARSMDPQQRLLLQETWHCLEDAGLDPASMRGSRTAVFAAVMAIDYHQNVTAPAVVPDAYGPLGNYAALLANRLSHFFGWTGESSTLDAACASSLIALHAARRALLDGSCDYAVVAAASVILNPWKYIAFSQAGMLSTDGRCHTFDAAANGYVPGEGAVVLLLQRDVDAIREGHRIDALVLGSAANHCAGAGTITSPVTAAQTEVIQRAVASADIPFDSIGYIEAHGTGTPLGDPIEVASLTNAFRTQTARSDFCRIGSVKTNIGHLEAAAGLAGVLKVILMMRHGRIVPTLNLERINPLIEFGGSPFMPATTTSHWPDGPRRAGVSSFGFGGANAHCVLEGPPEGPALSVQVERPLPFLLSAASQASLDRLLAAWRGFASGAEFSASSLADMCQTLMSGRQALSHRCGAVVGDGAEVQALLAAPISGSSSRPPRATLRLGDAAPLPTAVFAHLTRVLPPVARRYEMAVSAIGPPDGHPGVDTFVQLYALGGAMLDFGLQPAVIAGSGPGRWAALMLTGILSPKAAGALVRNEKSQPVPVLSRPALGYYDDVTGRLLRPLRADAAYLDMLRSGLRQTVRIPPDLLEAGRELRKGNATFNSDLASWQAVLGPRGDLDAWLAAPPDAASAQRILLLFLVWSRTRLRRRWGLAEPGAALPPAFSEVAALLCDDVLRPAAAVMLVDDTQADLDAIAHEIAERSALIDPKAAPPLLRGHAACLPEIGDPGAWLQAPPAHPFCSMGADVVVALDAERRDGSEIVALSRDDDPERAFLNLLVSLWCRGVAIDFAPLVRPHRIPSLPQTEFERHRHWIAREPPPDPASPLDADRVVWRSEGLIRDHVIDGRRLVPAAAMLWAVAQRAPDGLGLADVGFPQPAMVQDTCEARFEHAAGGFTLRADTGIICRGRFAEPQAVPSLGAAAREGADVDLDRFYARCAARGYEYGPSLRVIRTAWFNEDRLVAVLDASAAVEVDRPVALLDGALQAILLAAECWEPRPDQLLLPWHVGSTHITQALPAVLQAVVTRPTGQGGGIRASVTLVRPDGAVLATLADCQFRVAAGKARQQAAVPLFLPEGRPCAHAVLTHAPIGAIVVAEYAGGLAGQIAARLPDAQVMTGPDVSGLEAAMASGPEPRDVFLVWGTDEAHEASAQGFDRFSHDVLMPCAALLRRIVACPTACRLRVITRGLHATDDTPPPGHVAAAIAGMAKCIALEKPRLSVSVLAVPDRAGDGELDLLVRCFEANAELTVRGDQCLKQCLRPAFAELSGIPERRLRTGGTYLVVGGLGGVGKAIATRLMRDTGSRLFLVGRRPADAGTDAALAIMSAAAQRGSVHYLQGDVADRADVERIIATVRSAAGRIDGIINSAMVLADARFEAMDWPRFETALRPKWLGDLNLAAAVRNEPLDFLISFSSVLARSGHAGQANYVAACAAQTALAQYHAASGLPACSIEWGYWGESGRVATPAYRQTLSRIGLLGIEDDAAWEAFVTVLSAPVLPPLVIAARFGAGWRQADVTAEAAIPHQALAEGPEARAWRQAAEVLRREAAAGGDWTEVRPMNAALDAYAAATLFCRLQAAGLLGCASQAISIEALRVRSAPLTRHHQVFAAALNVLERHGYLERNGMLVRATSRAADAGRDAARLGAEIQRDFPAATGPRGLLDICLAHWTDVLGGTVPATDILFPNGGMERVLGFYQGNPLADRCNGLTAAVLRQWVDASCATGTRRLRILELGAGTGATTETVLSALAPFEDRIDYVYTDLSPTFLNHGRQRFGTRYPGIRYERLDLEAIADETASLTDCDAVLATNVVHATRHIGHSLNHIAARLRPGGLLLLNELTHGQDLLTLTFGLLDGWWAFRDARLPDGPLLGPAEWQAALATHFDAVEIVSPGAMEPPLQAVILARRRPSGDQSRAALAPALPAAVAAGSAATPIDALPPMAAQDGSSVPSLAVIRRAVSEALGIDEDAIDDDAIFTDIGVDSIVSSDVIYRIENALGTRFGPTLLNDHPTPRQLGRHLAGVMPSEGVPERSGAGPHQADPAATMTQPATERQRRLVVAESGTLDGVAIITEPRRTPAEGELEIAVSAAGLNFRDVMLTLGKLPPEHEPALGLEFAGTVVTVGPKVTGFPVGSQVFGVSPRSLAERVIAPAQLVAPLPARIGMAAASLPIAFLTAMRALEEIAGLAEGQSVLIHAASGGVGLAACQVARQAGAHVLATAGSEEKRRYLTALGIDCVMDSRGLTFAEEILAATGGSGVDVVLGAGAGRFVDCGLAALAAGGCYLELGKTDRREPAAVAARYPGVRYVVYDLLGEMLDQPGLVQATLERLTQRLEAGIYTQLPVRGFPFASARDAFRTMARAEHIGKILLRLDDDATVAAPPGAMAAMVMSPTPPRPACHEIAVVGAAGRFPGAPDLRSLWRLLTEGASAIGDVPSGRWSADEFAVFAGDENRDDPLLRRAGFIGEAENFDTGFFQLSPREALQMDPQQRVLLEEAWNALADAGHPEVQADEARCGVFVGASAGDYAQKLLLARQPADSLSLINALPSSLASRIAYTFDLKGPSLVADMGCVSGLAALQMACESLRRGESDIALAASVCVFSTPQLLAQARAAGILSRRGGCAAFADNGDGMVLSEAAVVFVLKPLDAALAGGDAIHGVIRAVGVNHDGATNGFATPASRHQTRLQRDLLTAAATPPASISYLEGHGVGSRVGDTTELWALKNAFDGVAPGTVAIGSVKANIGHTVGAAGLAGLAKVLLQFHHESIPPAPRPDNAVPRDLLAGSPFVLASDMAPWPRGTMPRRAAINGFAINGANAFAVVEEAPRPAQAAQARLAPAGVPILLAAHTETALYRRIGELAAWLEGADVALADLARTLAVQPRRLAWRAGFVAIDGLDLRRQLEGAVARKPARRWRVGVVQSISPETTPVFAAVANRLLAEGLADTDAGAGRAKLLAAVEMFVAGNDLAMGPLLPPGRRISMLPTYPFERTRCWPDSAVAVPPRRAATPASSEDPAESVRQILAGLLRLDAASVPVDRPLAELGVESILAIELRQRLQAAFGVQLETAQIMQSPSLTDLAARIDTAGPGRAGWQDVAVVPAGDADEPFPLSDIQHAYWIGRSKSLALGGNGCQIYWEYEHSPGWEIAQLEAAWRHLITCHDMLRAVVDADGNQRVLQNVPAYRFTVYDWRGLPEETAEAARAQVRQDLGATEFDPAAWPLFRLAISLQDGLMRLHFSIDLLVADVMSVFKLLRQLGRVYRDGPAAVAAPTLRFRDCLLRMRQLQEGADYVRSLDYWREQIATLPPAPRLPHVKAADALDQARVCRHQARVAPETWAALSEQARRRGLTPVTAVLAVFAEVLGHWAAEPRFTLNLTVHGRPALDPAIGEVIGDFTSTTLLAADTGGPAGFTERALALGQRLAAHLDHARVSGVRVLRLLSERSPGDRPLMPVVFSSTLGYGPLLGADGDVRDEPGRLVHGITRTPQVWLDSQLYEDGDGLLLAWDAVDELFPAGLIGAMFAAYESLLRRLATDLPLWDAPLGEWLRADEQARRRTSNATEAPVDAGLLHDPFLRHALQTPDRVAVIAPDRSMSYGALLAHAAAVAARLEGIAPNSLVAVALPKGWRQIVAVLGVMLAGAAYLPLDPNLPIERRNTLLRRSSARLVLTCAAIPPSWPDGVEAIDIDAVTALRAPPGPITPRCASTDLAYVIFTSGSTGEPKGVTIDHRGALNTVLDVNARFGVGPDDRVLAVSALGFDLSVYDIFGVLAAGGGIVIPRAESLADAGHLADQIATHRVTLWNSVPLLFQILLDDLPDPASLVTLRLVLLSGDWIPLTLPSRSWALAPGARVVSLGGATEASIWSIIHPIDTLDPAWPSIPYGRPMRNQRFHVLDESLADCPDWIPGELYIGGLGLAQGYWRDAERTAASFMHHPRTGERLYRTGDIGRYRDDGLIEFLGRRDSQIKVNGYRVELGEIEAVARRHPGLRDAVAVTCPAGNGGRRVVLFVVPAQESRFETDALRRFLTMQLPTYMLPARIETLNALPLSANGKLDRNALARRAGMEPAEGAEAPVVLTPRATGTDLETALIRLWRDLLPHAAIDPTVNLAEFGADSLAVVEVNRRIRHELGLNCSVTDIFEHPTIRGLAHHLAAAPASQPVVTAEAAAVANASSSPSRRSDLRRRFRAQWQ